MLHKAMTALLLGSGVFLAVASCFLALDCLPQRPASVSTGR